MLYLFSIFVFFSLVLVGISAASDRKLSYSKNPGCPLPQCKNGAIILIHVTAAGEKDTLHHIWDFSGKPSVVLAVTEPNATLKVDWSNFAHGLANSVKITSEPTYVYGVVLDEIIEFNDENDTGALNSNIVNSTYISSLDLKNFQWTLKQEQMQNDSSKFLAIMEGSGYNDSLIKKNGTVEIMMSAYAGTDHEDMLPRLLHTGNASQIDITLNKLSIQHQSSRFGIHLITVSDDNVNASVNIKGRQILDDEHAPGVFNIVEMLTPGAEGEDTLGGYLQWRPIVYTSPQRDMTNSTESIQYTAVHLENPINALNLTLLYSMYGYKLTDMLIVDTNVTFGVSGDGFFQKTNYAVWTFLAGYGHPPVEKFSMLVILVLTIGLGLPLLLVLVGGTCIFIRRLTRNKDDLFLSR